RPPLGGGGGSANRGGGAAGAIPPTGRGVRAPGTNRARPPTAAANGRSGHPASDPHTTDERSGGRRNPDRRRRPRPWPPFARQRDSYQSRMIEVACPSPPPPPFLPPPSPPPPPTPP